MVDCCSNFGLFINEYGDKICFQQEINVDAFT